MGRARRGEVLLYVASFTPTLVLSGLMCGLIGWVIATVIGATAFVAAWCLFGAIAFTRPGEGFVISELLKWKPIDLDVVAGFDARAELQRVTGTDVTRFAFYRASDVAGPNTLAIGGRSIGLTDEFIELCEQQDITAEEILAVLTHEVGHHSSGFIRLSAVLTGLAAPAFYLIHASKAVMRDMFGKSPWMIGILVVCAVLAGLGIVASAPVWVTVVVVSAVVVIFGVRPRATGRARQADEFRADLYAVDHGCGQALLAYLSYFVQPHVNWWQRVTDDHPPLPERIRRLQNALDELTPEP